jgi:hypothetical protein
MMDYHNYDSSPWAEVGHFHRTLTRFGPDVIKESKKSLELLKPLLEAALVCRTLDAAVTKRKDKEANDVEGRKAEKGLTLAELEDAESEAKLRFLIVALSLPITQESKEKVLQLARLSLGINGML